MSSRIPGFYKLAPAARLDALERRLDGNGTDLSAFRGEGLTVEQADVMVENVIGVFRLPNAVAVNFSINGRDLLVPMVVEEPSVVAAVSNMARLARSAGGFRADSDRSIMIGQIQLCDCKHPERAAAALREALPELRALSEDVHPRLRERGGGLVDLEIRTLRYEEPGQRSEDMVVLHVLLDCVDAMGANMVNTLCEHLAPRVGQLTGERVGLRILSNLADRRLARAQLTLPSSALDIDGHHGTEVAQRIAAAWRFAWADPYRAATHNKGVMNGIDALALATGNDWRAIEAGAHAYCCRDGQYRPMTRWQVDPHSGHLHGSLELPLQFGTVGGPIRVHPTVQANLELLGNPGARELAAIAAAVGLAQNLGALRALATEGIQQGHMRMHARTVAATAGARGAEVGEVASSLVEAHEFSVEAASKALAALRQRQ